MSFLSGVEWAHGEIKGMKTRPGLIDRHDHSHIGTRCACAQWMQRSLVIKVDILIIDERDHLPLCPIILNKVPAHVFILFPDKIRPIY